MARHRIGGLHYYGSKSMHLDFLLPLLPDAGTFVEPFGGSAAVLLNRPRSDVEVYSDIYSPLVALMRTIRDGAGPLAKSVMLTPYSRTEFRSSHPFPDDAPDPEVARIMSVRMMQGVGSLASRGSRTGWSRVIRYNTTSSTWAALPSKFAAISKRLQGVEILNRDALDVIREYDSPDTLFYLDPPYVFSTRNSDWAYSHEMSDDMHSRLAGLANSLDGMLAVSGYASPLYDELFPAAAGWTRHDGASRRIKPTPMAIAGTRMECLWTNY